MYQASSMPDTCSVHLFFLDLNTIITLHNKYHVCYCELRTISYLLFSSICGPKTSLDLWFRMLIKIYLPINLYVCETEVLCMSKYYLDLSPLTKKFLSLFFAWRRQPTLFSKYFWPEMFHMIESVQSFIRLITIYQLKGHLGLNYKLVFTCKTKSPIKYITEKYC
jgi:hypothetical protein